MLGASSAGLFQHSPEPTGCVTLETPPEPYVQEFAEPPPPLPEEVEQYEPVLGGVEPMMGDVEVEHVMGEFVGDEPAWDGPPPDGHLNE